MGHCDAIWMITVKRKGERTELTACLSQNIWKTSL